MKNKHLILANIALVLLTTVGIIQAATLDFVKKKGFLQCGVNNNLPGFSARDKQGNWKGFDVDVCRAVSAAIFGNKYTDEKVKYTPLTAGERFLALESGEIDILSRNTTWTMNRDTTLKLNFAGVSFYDGQGFMVRKDLDVGNVSKLNMLKRDDMTLCCGSGTTTLLNLKDYFSEHNMKYKKIDTFASHDQTFEAFQNEQCDVYSADSSLLYSKRLKLAKPDSVKILPEIISREPLGPVVPEGDDNWFNIVKWTLFALINAEEMGITSENVDDMKKSSNNPSVQRFLGVKDNMGKGLGLSENWAYHIIKHVGNYGEIFDRNVGKNSPLKIDRGLNALWNDKNKKGIMYAPPIR